MISIRPFTVLVCISLVLVFSACGPQPADCAGEDLFCVGMVTAYEGIEDHGLNQASWEALQNVAGGTPIARLDHIDSIDARDWEKNILFFVQNGYDIIVTVGSSLQEATLGVASDNPNVFFIGIDQQIDETYENVATVVFPEDRAGFLAGVLAGMVSSSGNVGAVCEASGIDTVWQYCEGFRTGAAYENEDIKVTVTYRENGDRDKTFNDPDWGKQSMLSLVNRGVDTVTAFGGNTAQGAFLAASEKRISIIGSEADLYYSLPDVQEVLLTSVLYDPGPALSALVIRASQGAAMPGPQQGAIGLAPFRRDPLTAQEMQMKTEEILQKIESGEIEIKLPEKP